MSSGRPPTRDDLHAGVAIGAIPGELEEPVLRCLDKDPGARPASARALAEDLSRVQRALSWTDEEARRWWSVHDPLGDGGAP